MSELKTGTGYYPKEHEENEEDDILYALDFCLDHCADLEPLSIKRERMSSLAFALRNDTWILLTTQPPDD